MYTKAAEQLTFPSGLNLGNNHAISFGTTIPIISFFFQMQTKSMANEILAQALYPQLQHKRIMVSILVHLGCFDIGKGQKGAPELEHFKEKVLYVYTQNLIQDIQLFQQGFVRLWRAGHTPPEENIYNCNQNTSIYGTLKAKVDL